MESGPPRGRGGGGVGRVPSCTSIFLGPLGSYSIIISYAKFIFYTYIKILLPHLFNCNDKALRKKYLLVRHRK